MAEFQPCDARGVAEVVAWANSGGTALEILGGGSKRDLGRPFRPADVLDVSRLCGVLDYDPPELVLTARSGTTLAAVNALVHAHGQQLAFEPPSFHAAGEPTLGGILACNLAGPRRVRAGGARDHLLGFAAVNGLGEAWQAGGRVVKNVSGYDMCKLQCGAFGTLSVLTEVTMRVVPAPATSCSLVVPCRTPAEAVPMMALALNTPLEVSAAAFLPAFAAARSAVPGLAAGAVVLRLEGHGPSVAHRADRLRAEFDGADILPESESISLWMKVGAVRGLLPVEHGVLWRVCPTPSTAAEVFARVIKSFDGARGLFDWGGGLLWITLPVDQAREDGGSAVVRGALGGSGHATLVIAPAALRARVEVFPPLSAPEEALTARVKQAFDPRHVLNPGRMREGR